MRFILVNHRIPCRPSTCAECSQSLGPGYVRDVPTRRPYCGFDCYLRYEMKSLTMPWLAVTRLDHGPATNYRAPLGMITSLAAVSYWWYAIQISAVSVSMAEAALRMRELLPAEASDPS
jgi:hypothetical protein